MNTATHLRMAERIQKELDESVGYDRMSFGIDNLKVGFRIFAVSVYQNSAPLLLENEEHNLDTCCRGRNEEIVSFDFAARFIMLLRSCQLGAFRIASLESKGGNPYKSKGDYESTVAQKPHSFRSNKKRIPEFVGEIQSMIDNDLSKPIISIARYLGVSEFLINRVVHENIRYFSNKMRKR